MARQARDRSQLKVYHAILRGVNKQQIFECTEDYEQFVRILQRTCGLPVETRPSKLNTARYYHSLDDDVKLPVQLADPEDIPVRHCSIYAWCLMGNHVHLLIKETDEPIGDVMKRIASSYVYYYNRKYDRVGHLFQERFKSQPVEDWPYFLTLLRYIHQNSLKPHLVKDLKDYRWSSWNEYLGRFEMPFTSVEQVFSRITLKELTELIYKPLTDSDEEGLIDVDARQKKASFSDDEVWALFESICGTVNATQFQALSRPLQKHYLYLAHEQGVGPRTLSRLTGVPFSVVQRATSAANERMLQDEFCHQVSSSVLCEQSIEEEIWLEYCDEDEYFKYPEY